MKRLNYYIHNIYILFYNKISTLALLNLVLIMTSCETAERQLDGHAKLTLMASNSKFTSKESLITEIDALIFVNEGNGYLFKERTEGTTITDAGNNITSFQLAITNTSLRTKIHVITNANNTITNSNISIGDTETIVKQKVNYNFTSDGITTGFPMWAEYEFASGLLSGLPNNSINMYALPALSRIDIVSSLPSSNFSISSIQGYRVNNLIQIIPDNFISAEQISTPSIPVSSNKINTTPIVVTGNSSTEQMYLSESKAPDIANQIMEATCIVVGGKYNNSATDTYYRLDFEPTIITDPVGEILRDRLYTFNITKVSSPGWETPDEAANNGSTNIQAQVVDWSDSNMDIDLGGNYFVNLSTREITLDFPAGSIGSTLIFTNVFDYTLQWSDAGSNPIGETNTVIENKFFRVTASRNVIVVDALIDNTTGNVQEDYFLIIAKRAQLLMKITQSSK